MVGSMKLAKINFRLQEIFENKTFMGGISVIASGRENKFLNKKYTFIFQVTLGNCHQLEMK